MRPLTPAETHTPELLHRFLARLEETENTTDVWHLIVDLGGAMGTPFIDFICASSFQDWRRTLFIRTSYDSAWLNALNRDPEISKWSYFRTHAMQHLTPVMLGYEYLDAFRPLPPKRVAVLQEAARRGLRAGFAVPLRLYAPPQAALVSFIGDYDRASFDALVAEHGWTMNAAAWAGHQRYMTHFVAEFSDRNEISDKQRALLRLVGMGWLDKQISHELGVSVSAIRQRMALLMDKTGCTNRAELAALAMSLGIVVDPMNRPGAETKRGETGFRIDMGPLPEGYRLKE